MVAMGLMAMTAYADSCDEYFAEYDPEAAIKVCQKALKKAPNDGELLFSLGVAYDTLEEYEKAFEAYSKAAKQGEARAQNNVGAMYEMGEGVTQNTTKAIEWYTKSANQGDSDAQYNLGALYEQGELVKRDYKKSAEWYTKAANQDDSDAQFVLGVYYLYGRGVGKNEKTAKEWFGKACDNGHLSACRLK